MTHGSPDDSGRPDPEARLRPTGPAALTGWAVAGLVLGWGWHRVAGMLDRPVPVVSWTQALVLFFVAAVLGGVAWATHRSLRAGESLVAPERMVNRLVLARACVLVAALLAGGYAGYALSWVGVASELRTERIVRAGVAAAGAVVMAVASLLLERACRVHSDDDAA